MLPKFHIYFSLYLRSFWFPEAAVYELSTFSRENICVSLFHCFGKFFFQAVNDSPFVNFQTALGEHFRKTDSVYSKTCYHGGRQYPAQITYLQLLTLYTNIDRNNGISSPISIFFLNSLSSILCVVF